MTHVDPENRGAALANEFCGPQDCAIAPEDDRQLDVGYRDISTEGRERPRYRGVELSPVVGGEHWCCALRDAGAEHTGSSAHRVRSTPVRDHEDVARLVGHPAPVS